MSALADEGAEPSLSQTVRALLALREAVLEGALQPGERISEPSMAKRIGLSRTPIRAALMRLEEEGLLDALPTGGYAVRAFTEGTFSTRSRFAACWRARARGSPPSGARRPSF